MLITWLAWLLAFFTLLGIATFISILIFVIMMYRFFGQETKARNRQEDEANAQAELDAQAFKLAVMTQIDEMFREFSAGEEK